MPQRMPGHLEDDSWAEMTEANDMHIENLISSLKGDLFLGKVQYSWLNSLRPSDAYMRQ